MYCKTYSVQQGIILAACDKELLGMNLIDGPYDVVIGQNFYRGEIVKEEELAKLLIDAQSINLFGKKAVGVALREGFLTEKDIITIAGIEHAVIFKM